MNIIDSFTLDELIEAYRNAETWIKRIKSAPSENVAFAMGMSMEEIIAKIVYDRGQIWLRLIQKIPTSHIIEIETLKNAMAYEEIKTDIAPGQRYEHKHTHGVILEVHRLNERLWVCGQYLENKYIMTCNVSTQVIMANYKRIDP